MYPVHGTCTQYIAHVHFSKVLIVIYFTFEVCNFVLARSKQQGNEKHDPESTGSQHSAEKRGDTQQETHLRVGSTDSQVQGQTGYLELPLLVLHEVFLF